MSKLQSALVVYGVIDEIARTTTTPAIASELSRRYTDSSTLGRTSSYGQLRYLSGELPGPVPPAIDVTALNNALADLAGVVVATDTAPDANNLTRVDLARLNYALESLEIFKTEVAKGDPAAPLLEFNAQALITVKKTIAAALGGAVSAPPKCTSFVRKVGSDYCTVLLTESTSATVTMEQITELLDPLNWAKCSTFFREMAVQRPPTDEYGWSRVLEVVGTGDGEGFELKTPLKYFKGEIAEDGSKFVNYDMDDHAAEDAQSDHLVVIDNGYIVATPFDKEKPGEPGVRLLSSKELLIRGLSPTATAILACRLGWADAGNQMFFDTAVMEGAKQKLGLVPWTKSPDILNPPPVRPAERPAEKVWKLPVGNRRQIIETAETEATTIVANTADAIGDVVDRWRNGLDPEDVTAIGENLGRKLSQSYQSLFNTALDAVRPAKGGTKQP